MAATDQHQAVLVVFRGTGCGFCKTFTAKVWPSVLKEIGSKKINIKVEIDEDSKNKNVSTLYRTQVQGVPSFLMVPTSSWTEGSLTGAMWKRGALSPNPTQKVTDQMAVADFIQWMYGAYQTITNPPPPTPVPAPAPVKEPEPDVCSKSIRSRNGR